MTIIHTNWRRTASWLLLMLAATAAPLGAQDTAGPATTDGPDPAIRVTLLGTGRPDPAIDRFGPSTLVEAGGETLLIDCGRGAAQRLWQRRIPLSRVGAVFLTHLHSDHTVGLPDLWLTGWLPTPFGRRTTPLGVWGPAGTQVLQSGPYRLFFFSSDRGEPVHVHVARERKAAKFWLGPVRLEYSHGFTKAELSQVTALVREHEAEIQRA